jgi:flagellar basal-body rod modification protein FlgD
MAAAATGIWNHHAASAGSLAGAKAVPMAGPGSGTSSTGSTSTSTSDSATISANDFLTLLVTEMQNQDPTADTDPNEYINQLVNVNSLEQLISINQNLSTALGVSSTSSSGTSTDASVAGKGATRAASGASGATHQGSIPAGAQSAAAAGSTGGAKVAPGNLSVPETKPAAHRVASALNGRPHAHASTSAL